MRPSYMCSVHTWLWPSLRARRQADSDVRTRWEAIESLADRNARETDLAARLAADLCQVTPRRGDEGARRYRLYAGVTIRLLEKRHDRGTDHAAIFLADPQARKTLVLRALQESSKTIGNCPVRPLTCRRSTCSIC